MTPSDLRQVVVGVRSGMRAMTKHEIDYLLSNDENKVFQENLNTLKAVISRLKTMGYKLSPLDIEEIGRLVSKVFDRSSSGQNRRFYSSIYVFLAVLYHYLSYLRLDKQRREILDDIAEASIDFVDSNDPKQIKRQIERKYAMIRPILVDEFSKSNKHKVTLADKIIAVAERFGLNGNEVKQFAEKVIDYEIVSNHSADSVSFGVVYYYLKEILKKDLPPEVEKQFTGGAKTVYQKILRKRKLTQPA